MRGGILGEDSLNFVIQSVLKVAPFDSGVANRDELKALQQALQPKLRFKGLDFLALEQLVEEIESEYLSCWANAVTAPPTSANPERVARAVASHLLDLGFNSDLLKRWLRYHLYHAQQPRTSLSNILHEAHTLANPPVKLYEVLVPIESAPSTHKFGMPDGWLDATSVSGWLRTHGFATSSIRQSGGIRFILNGRDGRAAADAAADLLENLSARARIATAVELRHLGKAWVSGEKEPYDIRQRSRGLDVGALIRQNVVYNWSGPEDEFDAASEMLAPLQASSPIAAIAAGWTAIEALLSEPNDRGGAADRLASQVACSFTRAKLTALSYVLEREDADMREILRPIKVNRDRAAAVAREILDGRPFALGKWTDKAAVERIRPLLRNPSEVLQDVQSYAAAAFRRLYRQRNLVLHGGKTNASALRACLRTATPLVGAGMDRLAHSYYVNKTTPLATAARARIAITTASSRHALFCVYMLP